MIKDAAFKILKKLNSNGFLAYIVGGYVRDYLLNIDSDDIDITTNALPQDIKNIFSDVELKGEKYLSVVVKMDGYSFEVTTFRKDISYIDHRHPVTEKTDDLIDDLKRRDFTINALIMDSTSKVLDYYDGLSDLKNKKIKAIGDIRARFEEDSLRILRACHFVSKLGFEIEQETFNSMKMNAKYVSSLSSERVIEELEKILKGKYYIKGLNYLLSSTAASYLGMQKALSIVITSKSKPTIDEILALTRYFNEGSIIKTTTAKEKEYQNAILLLKNDLMDKIILYNNDIQALILANHLKGYLFDYNMSDDILIEKKNKLVIQKRSDIKISIPEIISIVNKDSGPWIKSLISKIEYNILQGTLENEKKNIDEYIRRIMMSDIEYFNYYVKIKGMNSSDGMLNMLVTLPNLEDINIKTETTNTDLKIGYIYKVRVGRHNNSDREVYYLFDYQKISEMDNIDEVDMAYRLFDNSCPYTLHELKNQIYGYVDLIGNKKIQAITKKALDEYDRLFFIYPAGQRLHHNYVGGLAHHTLGMLKLAQDFAKNFPYLDKDYLYSGVILHDLGKTIEFTGVENTEYSLQGQLLGHLVIGGFKVYDIAKGLGLENSEEALILEHIVISHHGQPMFGACKKPQTAEAAAIWYIDTIDSKFRVLGNELEKTKQGEFTDIIGVMDKTKFYKLK